MSNRLDWWQERRDWPNADASRFVSAGGSTWHVQGMGEGPVLLLAHGTGASTHSWRDLAPLLAPRFTIVAPDLPGHGFTEMPPRRRLSLSGMGRLLAALLDELELSPALAAGHSAGAAILAYMCLAARIRPAGLVSLNGALLPLSGIPGHVFSPIAKLVAGCSLLSNLFAWRAGEPAVVERMIRETGSTLDRRGIDLYARLARDPEHVNAALNMMAMWDLRALAEALPRLEPHLLLVVGSRDGTIPPATSARVQRLVPGSDLETLDGLGHLAHEERPDLAADLLVRHAKRLGVLTSP